MTSPLLRNAALGLIAALVLFGVLTLTSSPELLGGARFVDSDGYMRLVRVRRLAETGAWFDSSISRSNWPDGEVLHWTRPLDVALLALAGVLTPLMGFEAALHHAGVWVAPLLLLGTFAATFWAGIPLVPRQGRGFIALALLAQPTVLSYGLPARPDHHALILFLFALTLGFGIRAFAEPRRKEWAMGLGISAGAGLWVSPEFLLPVGVLLMSGVICWLLLGDQHLIPNRRWTGAMAVAVLVFLVVERGPDLLTVEYDRISLAHLAVALIARGFWGVLSAASGRIEDRSAPARAGLAGLAGVAGLVTMALAFPPFFGGPMSEVDDPLVRTWLGQITELQPVLFPSTLPSLGLLLVTAGSALLVLPFLVWTVSHRADPRGPRILLVVGLVVSLSLALAQARWVTYAEMLSVPALAELVTRVRHRLARRQTSPTTALAGRVALSTSLIAGPLLIGTGLMVGTGSVSEERQHVSGGCDPERVAALMAGDGPGAPHRTIAASMDLGPTLLYRTNHRVLATPYHRNAAGIRRVYELLAETDPAEALGRVERWGIDTVILCPDRDGVLYPTTTAGETTLYGRLVAGEGPDWLVPEPAAKELGSVLIFTFSGE